MMRTFFSILSLLIFSTAFAQKSEFSLGLNSGLFHFSGASAVANSQINHSDDMSSKGYTNNPYGSRNGLSYGISGNWKKVSRRNILWGVDLGLELLQSKVVIDWVNSYGNAWPQNSVAFEADGRTHLKYVFVNANPFVGQRFVLKNVNLDLTGGLDIAYCLAGLEKGKATASNGVEYTSGSNRKSIRFDVRPRVQVGGCYKEFGAYLGYSFGLSNYKSHAMGGINECYSRLFRFGLTYRLK